MVGTGRQIETLEKPLPGSILPKFALAPETKEPPRIPTIEEIAKADRWTVIHHIVQALDNGLKLPSEIVEALLSRTVLDLYTGYLLEDNNQISIPFPNAESVKFPYSEWPSKDKTNLTRLPKYQVRPGSKDWLQHQDYAIAPGSSITFPRGLLDVDDFDALARVTKEAFDRLEPEEKVEAHRWLLENLHDQIPEGDYYDFMTPYFLLVKEAENKKEILALFLEYLYSKRSKYRYDSHDVDLKIKIGSPVEELTFWLWHHDKEGILEAIADFDRKKQKILLGMFINSFSYPEALNTVRNMLLTDKPLESKAKLERIGKLLLNRNPDDTSTPFHRSLEEFYQAFNIGEYQTNNQIHLEELGMICSILGEKSLPKGAILDLACGQGRIANGLAKQGFQNVFGLDISSENLAIARTKDTTQSIQYFESDWRKIPLETESCKMVVAVGRDFHHAQGEEEFRKVALEVKRVLKPGGVFLLDFANPDEGPYLRNRIFFLEMLEGLGIPKKTFGSNLDQQVKKISRVVDSPDGVNFYNRWVPQIEIVVKILKRVGFEVEIYARKSIPGWERAENIYLKATKR